MNQKDEERLVMNLFRSSYPEFPKGKIASGESPDFILRLSPRRSFGMELTQLFQADNPISDILSLIKKKEEKIPLYQHIHLSELWLIIYADEALNNIKFNLRNKIDNLTLTTKFDRVFLFDLFSKEVYGIKKGKD